LKNYVNLKLLGKGIYIYSDPAAENSILSLVDDLILSKNIPKKDFLVYTNKKGKIDSQYKDIVKVEDFKESRISKLILDFKPEYFFLGTSLNDYEHNWRKIGIKYNIKVISYIDHWTNYIERFSFGNEIIFGDYICVINDVAKSEAAKAGIPEKIINVIGNPYYKKVKKFKPKVSKEYFYNSLGLDIRKKVILFISDDIKRSFPSDDIGNCVLGFDEYTVLSDIIIGLKKIDIDLRNFQLVLKLHPKSDVNKFKHLLSDIPQNLNVIAVKDCDSLTINYFSDYVIGMFSNMIIESFLMNKKLLRVQTGQVFKDIMKLKPLNEKVLIKKEELYQQINDFLN
jgi:hypothetical protein